MSSAVKRQTSYVAMTTLADRYWVILEGEGGESLYSVRERAERTICGDQWDKAKDTIVDTSLKNLTVVSRSQAMRRFPKAWAIWQEYGQEAAH